MKKLKFALLATLLALPTINIDAQVKVDEPLGTITYCLPSTVINLEVEAQRSVFYAGPYAKYAQKYLGIDARQKDEITTEVTNIKMTPMLEADHSARFVINPGKSTISFLQLTSQGLVCTGDDMGNSSVWRFPTAFKENFADKGVTSNLTSEATTLYRNIKAEDAINKVAIQQNMVVTKSLDTKAKEAADMIISLRKKRYQIATGDTDASYSGEAMGAALEEISKMEKEYLSLFIGYTDTQIQKMNYDVVPEKGKDMYIAFRVSQSQGLVPADDMSGKPYMLKLVPEKMTVAQGKKSSGDYAYYRIPAVCDVQLSDGANVVLQSRVPVYQLGIVSTFPIKTK